MTKTFRLAAVSAALSAVTFAAAGSAQAQTCNPGILAAYALHQPQFDKLASALRPGGGNGVLDGFNAALDAIGSGATFADNQALYQTLLTGARNIVTTINTPAAVGGRVLITLPDGTVVVDTGRADAPLCDTTAPACAGWNGYPVTAPAGCACNGQANSYGHYLRKSVNENHASRIAIHDAQEWPCAFGLETKFSSSTGTDEHYLAIRLASPALGGHLDSTGTVRASLRQ